MDRRAFLRSSGVLTTAGLAGCPLGGGGDAQPTSTDANPPAGTPTDATVTVDMENTAYSPAVLEVAAGTTVEWVNRDSFPHDVAAAQFNDGATSWDFRSEAVGAGGTVTRPFDSEGVYEYYCTIHGRETMCGVVLVGGASKAGSLPCESDDGGGIDY